MALRSLEACRAPTAGQDTIMTVGPSYGQRNKDGEWMWRFNTPSFTYTQYNWAGAHHRERTSTLYPCSNLCPDWAIFRNVFPANFCLHCGPYMTEINAEKNGGQSEVPHPSFVFLDHFLPFPRWFRSYADRNGVRRSPGNNSKNS